MNLHFAACGFASYPRQSLQIGQYIGALRKIPINSIFAPFFSEAFRACPFAGNASP
jgi:hypothetical protein